MKHAVTILSILFAHILFSQQDSAWLDVNNVKAQIRNENKSFAGKNFQTGFFFPKGTNQSTIFHSAIWMRAFKSNGDTCVAAHRTGPQVDRQDFFFGPISGNPQQQGFDFFRQVFPIRRNTINTHINQWNNSNGQPLADSTINSDILKYPAKGNPFLKSKLGIDITQNMAPFVDIDLDGIYNPNKGDYPDICGDMAVYWVMNDAHFPHTETGGKSLGVEIHAIAYAFESSDSAIANTVFFSYNFINKSNEDLLNFQMAQYSDFDIGGSPDDYFGCDSALNMFYGYQADAFDESANSITGYGSLKASAACVFLNEPLHGAHHFYYTISGPPTTIPFNTKYVSHAMNGLWLDGSPITVGGNGYGGIDVTKYQYSGDPSDNQQWSECSEGETKGDRKSLGSITPRTLPKDSSIKVDLAFVSVLDNGSLCNIDSQKQYVQRVAAYYQASNLPICHTVRKSNGTVVIASISDLQSPINFSLHPNPATTHFTITTPHNLTGNTLTIHNTIGQQVATHTIPSNHTIPLHQLPKGIYYIQTHHLTTPIKTKLIIL